MRQTQLCWYASQSKIQQQALLIDSRSCSCGCQTLKECHMREDPGRGSGALPKLGPAFALGDISVWVRGIVTPTDSALGSGRFRSQQMQLWIHLASSVVEVKTWSQCQCGALTCPAEPPLLQGFWLSAEGCMGVVTSYPKAHSPQLPDYTNIYVFIVPGWDRHPWKCLQSWHFLLNGGKRQLSACPCP